MQNEEQLSTTNSKLSISNKKPGLITGTSDEADLRITKCRHPSTSTNILKSKAQTSPDGHNQCTNISELPEEKSNVIHRRTIHHCGTHENSNSKHLNCDTRGQQWLLLTLERLRLLALEHRPLDLYSVFNELISSLSKNQTGQQNNSVDNVIHCELSSLIRKLTFKRKFIYPNQAPLYHVLSKQLSHGSFFDPVWNPNSSDFIGRVRHGHFSYITSKGFRSWSTGRLFCSQSSFIGFNNTTADLCSSKGSSAFKVAADRKFLESINVLNSVNLRNPNTLYHFRERAASEMVLQNQSATHQYPPPSLSEIYNKVFAEQFEDHMDENIVTSNSNPAFINDESIEIEPPIEEKPSILDFQITIGHNRLGTLHETTRVTPSISTKTQRPQSIKTDEEFFFEFDRNEPVFKQKYAKKSVSFTPETIFIERDMDSPFWREFSERRRQRQIIKERRLMKTKKRLTFFDIVKMAFTSHKSKNNPRRVSVNLDSEHLATELEESSDIPDTSDLNLIQYQVVCSHAQNCTHNNNIGHEVASNSKLSRIKTLLDCTCCNCTGNKHFRKD